MPVPPTRRLSGPPVGARTLAGFVCLGTSVGMFLLDGLDTWLCRCQVDLQQPAWAFLVLAAYVLFGVNLHRLMGGAISKDERDD